MGLGSKPGGARQRGACPYPRAALEALSPLSSRGTGGHHERRHSPRLPASTGRLRLRRGLRDSLHSRELQRRSLRQLPPVLHRQAEGARHQGPRRSLPEEVREEGVNPDWGCATRHGGTARTTPPSVRDASPSITTRRPSSRFPAASSVSVTSPHSAITSSIAAHASALDRACTKSSTRSGGVAARAPSAMASGTAIAARSRRSARPRRCSGTPDTERRTSDRKASEARYTSRFS